MRGVPGFATGVVLSASLAGVFMVLPPWGGCTLRPVDEWVLFNPCAAYGTTFDCSPRCFTESSVGVTPDASADHVPAPMIVIPASGVPRYA